MDNPEDKNQIIIAALIRLDSLKRLANRSKVFETFIVDNNGIFLSHTDSKKINTWVPMEWLHSLKEIMDQKSMQSTIEYRQNDMDMIVGFARSELSGLITGVQISKVAVYLTSRDLLSNLIGTAFIMLIASAILGLFISKIITRSIDKLTAATRMVAKGNFEIHVEMKSLDEIGLLASSFNQMASELKTREVALKEAQVALIQSEKMAAFGQLGAGIAHEVKNPLTGILGYAQISMRKLEPGSPLYQNIEIIEKETKRCRTIIENLLKFACQEKVKYDPIDINMVVVDAIKIVEHQLAINKVKLEKDIYPGLPRIIGNSNQLQQVLMNLLINAQQAMEGCSGTIKVSTHLSELGKIEILVSDNGPGIPKGMQAKIFEPFFTTKPTGKGTGLGLSVSYGIVKEHRGDIHVESEPGNGAAFVITLPVQNQSAIEDQVKETVRT
jgi:signal transduction histidine kinase